MVHADEDLSLRGMMRTLERTAPNLMPLQTDDAVQESPARASGALRAVNCKGVNEANHGYKVCGAYTLAATNHRSS